MPLTGAVAPYGIRNLRVITQAGTSVDLPWARALKFTEEPSTQELEADDTVVATVTFLKKLSFEIEQGGIDLAAYAALTGRTLAAAGTTPNQTQTLTAKGGDAYPYIKLYGRAITDAGDIHVKFPRAKIEQIEGEFKNGEFMIRKCTGSAIADTNGDVMVIVRNETATNLPTT